MFEGGPGRGTELEFFPIPPARRVGTVSRADAHVFEKMARETGLEPATSGVTGRRSNQLSYSPAGERGR
jgi:hypothetical protein